MTFDLQRFSSLLTVQEGTVVSTDQGNTSGGSGNNFSDDIKDNVISFFNYNETYADIAPNTMTAIRTQFFNIVG